MGSTILHLLRVYDLRLFCLLVSLSRKLIFLAHCVEDKVPSVQLLSTLKSELEELKKIARGNHFRPYGFLVGGKEFSDR